MSLNEEQRTCVVRSGRDEDSQLVANTFFPPELFWEILNSQSLPVGKATMRSLCKK